MDQIIYNIHKKSRGLGWLVLLAGSLLMLFPGTNSMQILLQGDEYMHIATVRQSLLHKAYLIPVLEGAPNYFKPPIMFWMGMLSEAMLGNYLWAVRLPAVLAGVATALGIYFFLRELRVPALLPAFFYVFTLGSMKFGRLLMMEQFLALSMLGTAYFMMRYQRLGQERWIFMAGLVAAVAYFFKGPLFQIYASFLFMAWAMPRLLRFDPIDGYYKGSQSIKQVLRAGVIFSLPLLLPLAWNFYLYFFEPAGLGKALLEFFFINENAAKFGQQDQSAGLIALGWVIYTFPWTLIVPGAIIIALRNVHALTLRRHIGYQLMGVALAISLLHLLPNRKDPYYVLPALPLLMVGLSLLFATGLERMRHFFRANLLLTSGVMLLVAMAMLLIDAEVWQFVVLLAIALINFIIFLKFTSVSSVNYTRVMLLAGGLVMVGLQFVAIPAFAEPRMPTLVRQRSPESLCVVSDEAWDAFAFQAVLPETRVRHTVPANLSVCTSSSVALVNYSTATIEPGHDFKQIASWYRWQQNLDARAMLQNFGRPEKMKHEVLYYERKPE